MSAETISPSTTALERVDVGITERAAKRLKSGNLWVFSNEVTQKPPDAAPARLCRFVWGGDVVASGYFNPHSLIAGRALALGDHEDVSQVLRQRLDAAFRRRGALAPTDARRLVFSEADLLPGLVADVYGRWAVLQSSTAGMDLLLDLLQSLVPEMFAEVFSAPLQGLVVRADAGIRRLEGVDDFVRVPMGGDAAARNVSFVEGDVRFAANLIEGQKTGFFLDQRENRDRLARAAAVQLNGRVLDLYAYIGGWGLRALKAGAGEATFVDASADAAAAIRSNAALNDIPEARARVVVSDVFEFLESEKGRYDFIVADPPAFVKSRKNLGPATRAYEKLNRLCWRRLKPGGVLFTSSCSFHVPEEEFVAILQGAVAKEGGLAHVVYRGTQAADHPILLSMPETRYLKCLGLRKLDQR